MPPRNLQYSCVNKVMEDSQAKGLTYDILSDQPKLNEDMLTCMVELGEDIKEVMSRDFLYDFARLYGVEFCPVYSVIGSIISQEIIKVVESINYR